MGFPNHRNYGRTDAQYFVFCAKEQYPANVQSVQQRNHFDEVQAFPVRGTELFNLAVNFLTVFCNTTVVLCSATQPSLASLKENNLFNCIEMAGSSKRYADAFKRVEIEDKTGLVPGGMQPEDIS